MTISEKLKVLIEEQKNQSFINPKKTTDCEALGLMISQFCKWDGNKIFESSFNAFEDANHHTFNEKFEKIWKGGN